MFISKGLAREELSICLSTAWHTSLASWAGVLGVYHGHEQSLPTPCLLISLHFTSTFPVSYRHQMYSSLLLKAISGYTLLGIK